MPARKRQNRRPRGPAARYIERQPVPYPGLPTRDLAGRASRVVMVRRAREIAHRYGEEI